MAGLDASIAAGQRNIILKQANQGGDAVPVMTPKDVERANMEERQRFAEMLDAALQLRKAQVLYLRQTGTLQQWIDSLTEHISASD